MRFAVLINGKKYPVTVMREPNNTTALSNFDYEGRTYKGLPTQFSGLRFDEKKKSYTATSVLATEPGPVKTASVAILEEEPIPEIHEPTTAEIVEAIEDEIPEPKSISDLDKEVFEEIPESESEEQESEKTEIEERKHEFLELLQRQSDDLRVAANQEVMKITGCNSKKANFRARWPYIFPEAEEYGQGLFERHKTIWIKQHGSEHLQMAFNMRCKCDSLYVQERAKFEFPEWSIHENLVYYEIDSVDFGTLTFLKNFKKIYYDIINSYRSKLLAATTDDAYDEDNLTVVIADYLGHADLSIPLVNLVDKYGDNC